MDLLNLYKLLSIIGNLFFLNCCFLLVNLPLVLLLLLFPINIELLPILFLCSWLLTPGLVTIFSVCGRWLRDGSVNVFPDYFTDYLKNLKQSILLGILASGIFTILVVDIVYAFSQKQTTLLLFSCLLCLVCLMAYLVQCCLISRFNITFKNMVKASIYVALHFFSKAFLALSCIVSFIALLLIFPALALTIGFGSVGYWIMIYMNPLLEILEKDFITT